MSKEEAIKKVYYGLKNPLVLMSVVDREECLTLAREHGITAEDLINYSVERNRRA
jgi:hypothetical protein